MVIQFENVKLIIFDFDGVLFNGLEAIHLGVRNAIEKYSLDCDFNLAVDEIAALIQKLMPLPIPKIVLSSYKLLQELTFLGDRTFFKKLQVGLSIYQQYLKEIENMGLFEGISDMLSILNGKNIKFAIFTSGTKKSVMEKLEKAAVLQYFPENLIIGAGEVPAGRVKPDPTGIEIIVKRMGIPEADINQSVIMVGDMHTDVLAGKGAFNGKGVKTVAIRSGYDSSIVGTHPDLLLEKTTQLLSHFK